MLSIAACGPGGSRLPDYAEMWRAGVDPREEAAQIAARLEEAGYSITTRIEGAQWVALAARRGDQSSIRVMTARGTALAMDSHETDGVRPRHGPLALARPPREETHDLDGDGRDDVLVASVRPDHVCVIPFEITTDGSVTPIAPDLSGLPESACIESFRDVDGNGRLEGIAVLRVPRWIGDETPEVEAPIELDASGRFVAGPPPVAFTSQTERELAAALAAALRRADPLATLRVAIQLAGIALVARRSRDQQLAAFDAALRRAVIPEVMLGDFEAAREAIGRGDLFGPVRSSTAPPPRAR